MNSFWINIYTVDKYRFFNNKVDISAEIMVNFKDPIL